MKLSIVTIGLFVGMLNQATKYIATNFIKRDVSKFIPICSVIYGILFGVIGYFMPGVDMGSDLLEAIFIGISAGSASTGVHQIGKQLKTPGVEEPEPEEELYTDECTDSDEEPDAQTSETDVDAES